MAKGQKRSNREQRKPKQKKTTPEPENTFANQMKQGANPNQLRRKGAN